MESRDSGQHDANLHNVLDNKQTMTAENPFSSEFINEADKLERPSSLLGNSCSLLRTPQSSLVFPNSLFDYQHNFSNHYGDSSSGVNQNRDDFDKMLRQKVSADQAMLDLSFDEIFTSAFKEVNLCDRIASSPNCHISEQASCSRVFSLDGTRGKLIAGDDQQLNEANGSSLEPVNARVCRPISQQQYFMDATFREPWYQQCEFNQQYYTDETRGKLIAGDDRQQNEANGSSLEPVNARVCRPIAQQQYYMDAAFRERWYQQCGFNQQYYTDATGGEPWYRHCSFKDEEKYTSQPQHLYTQHLQIQSPEHVRGSRSYPPTSIPYGPAQGNANRYAIANVVDRNYNSSVLGSRREDCHLPNSSLIARRLESSPAYDQCSNLVFTKRGNIFTGNFEDRYMHDSFDKSFRELRISENAPDGLVFQEGSHEEDNEMFDKLIDDFVGLITNSLWSSLAHKMVRKCNEERLTLIVKKISTSGFGLLKLCCNHHATRVVQKIIEKLKRTEQYHMIVVALKPHIVALIKDSNGSHVAECCFKFPPEYREQLFEAAVINCVELAKDGQGCCVLQKYMEVVQGDPKFELLRMLASNALDLSQDPSGNYVVQHILDQEISWATDSILDQLEGYYASLSLQKVASHVVEKCLTAATGERQASIILELIGDPHTLLLISQHQYGNYVIQTARKQCTGALLAAFRETIKLVAPELGSNPYGKKVLASINRKK